MGNKFYIKTYGCQMNSYDSSRIGDLLRQSLGLESTDIPEEAQVLIINTCSVREKAQEKLFHQLGRWRELKQNNPDIVIAIGGCVASQEGEAIRKRSPLVDIIFGPQTLHRLPQMVKESKAKKGMVIDISFPEIEKFDHLPAPSVEGVTAFVSIMEGCSKYCTFCIVPYTRGEEVSRPVADVIAECTSLAERGVREINLLGQNVNAYLGAKMDNSRADLAELITLVAAIDGIDRIRFTTSHPVEFSDQLINIYDEVPELVSHLHLPVQSGSDRILAMMKRGHTALEYKSKVLKLRKKRPNLSLSSDFIVGFPSETERDFEQTMKLIKEMEFDHSFSFIYSRRPGTPAAGYFDDVSETIKRERLNILQDCIKRQAMTISRGLIGETVKILVTDFSKKEINQLQGRTECNRVVNFDCDDPSFIGSFVDVIIDEALPNSLRGRLLG